MILTNQQLQDRIQALAPETGTATRVKPIVQYVPDFIHTPEQVAVASKAGVLWRVEFVTASSNPIITAALSEPPSTA